MTRQDLAPFSLLVKPAGAACNLACGYCFYLEKAALYPGSPPRMPRNILKAFIRQYLASQPAGEVTIAWQGGEPTLMGLDFFKESVKLARQYRRFGQELHFSIQTNGILLDDAWGAFLREQGFLVGLSLDGPAPLHDLFRLDQGGSGSFTRVCKAWGLLATYGVETNILCAIHAANSPRPLDVYRFFRDDLGARFLQFIPIVERMGGAEASPRSVQPSEWGRFLSAVFDEWVRRDVGTVFVQAFDSALAAWCGLPAAVCTAAETCGNALVLEHTGDLYSCDHFVDAHHRLGNILDGNMAEMAHSAEQRRFGLAKRDSLPACCRECDVLFACRGECPRNRFLLSPLGEPGLNYLCEGYRQFFRHISAPMERMASLLRQGREVKKIMRQAN